jgi:predicted Zn-dependent peptidase
MLREVDVYRKVTLDNGLRVLTVDMPHTRSVGIGFFTAVGSRYEDETQRGISHFVEHMLFKGTDRRPNAQIIAEAIEGLGGILNASTGSEVTSYWAKVAHHHLPIALDVLLDILRHSRLEPEEIEKERQVILQEISRMVDSPESWVHVLMDELLWPDHPVGWEIAGTKESVSSIGREQILNYLQSAYLPCNTVVSLAGNLDHDKVLETLSQGLADWQPRAVPSFLASIDGLPGPSLHVEFKETEQAHLCLGLRGISYDDPAYFALRLLNVILGEGMSSRLWLEIREKRGLAYSVGSYTSHLSDTGAVVLYAGVPPQQAGDVISAMVEQLALLREGLVPEAELRKAKEYLKGHMLLRMEDTFANAHWFGKQEALNQQVLTVDQVVDRLEVVTAPDIQQVAERLFDAYQLRLAAIGPFKGEGDLRSRLTL